MKDCSGKPTAARNEQRGLEAESLTQRDTPNLITVAIVGALSLKIYPDMSKHAATTILIADQYRLIRKAFVRLFSETEHIKIIGEADKGSGLLELMQNSCPDIVLLDVDMPEMNGLQTIRTMIKKFPDTKIVVVSTMKEKIIIDKLISWGVNGFVSKNSSPEDLITAIEVVKSGHAFFCSEYNNLLTGDHELQEKPPGKFDLLSKRQKEIILLIERGGTSRSISAELFLSIKTIECHRSNIYKKLNVKNVAELIHVINHDLLSK